MADFAFDTSYARLPPRFHARVTPTPVRAPRLIELNRDLAVQLGLDPESLSGEAGAQIFSGNRLPENAASIATAYAGHQFGVFVPQLGDGRAILLGEVIDRDGVRRDIQLKGAGRTPFSRGGDGRAAVGPVLREYLLSEAMAALGIATTRALAAVTTGEPVLRETVLPGAIITRVASSHIRVGTFQFFASRRDVEGTRLLADHVIQRHYPEAAEVEDPYRALLDEVIRAQALLVADWLLVGFIHGVMNTDNTSIAGETIDYGPCAFMDHYDPEAVFSAIDRNARYAYFRQPEIAEWNLARLAECLLPLLADDPEAALAAARDSLSRFAEHFNAAYRDGLARKIGLVTEQEGDVELVRELLNTMAENQADFTLTFRALAEAAASPERGAGLRALFAAPDALDDWIPRWRSRLDQEPGSPGERTDAMRALNPMFIPRNHRVEEVIRAAEGENDFAPFARLLAVLSRPFDDQPDASHYAQPPEEHERVHRTFCGT
jgi:serine/tyrosine/threonine adenylyltransferase